MCSRLVSQPELDSSDQGRSAVLAAVVDVNKVHQINEDIDFIRDDGRVEQILVVLVTCKAVGPQPHQMPDEALITPPNRHCRRQ
jgi:hypothetical protein